MTFLVAWRRCVLALSLASWLPGATPTLASDRVEFAQAQPQLQPAPQPTPTPTASPAADAQQAAAEEPIGNVATVTGIATVIREKNSYPLRVRDDIYLNDIVQTASSSSLGITFSDATTFNLSASARITIDNYVYEDGGKQNSAIFDVGKGTVAFVAAAVAKTGDMQITTPTAALGIRGTTGVVEVPEGAPTAENNVNIKLYPDADGRVGHIDVNDRTSGTRLGALTTGASGLAIRPGAGGVRFAAVPITIAAQQLARDRAFVGQVHQAQTAGRQIFAEQRDFRRANPGTAPRIPRPQLQRPNGQPGQLRQQRPNGAPGQQPQRRNGLPGQNRPGQQQPGTPSRQGAQPPRRPGQDGAVQPESPHAGQGQPRGRPRTPPASTPSQAPRSGQIPQQPVTTPQLPRTGVQPGRPVQPPGAQQPDVQHPGGLQQRLPGGPRPASRKPAPAPKEKRERR